MPAATPAAKTARHVGSAGQVRPTSADRRARVSIFLPAQRGPIKSRDLDQRSGKGSGSHLQAAPETPRDKAGEGANPPRGFSSGYQGFAGVFVEARIAARGPAKGLLCPAGGGSGSKHQSEKVRRGVESRVSAIGAVASCSSCHGPCFSSPRSSSPCSGVRVFKLSMQLLTLFH